jgi:hypothetical protein
LILRSERVCCFILDALNEKNHWGGWRLSVTPSHWGKSWWDSISIGEWWELVVRLEDFFDVHLDRVDLLSASAI